MVEAHGHVLDGLHFTMVEIPEAVTGFSYKNDIVNSILDGSWSEHAGLETRFRMLWAVDLPWKGIESLRILDLPVDYF